MKYGRNLSMYVIIFAIIILFIISWYKVSNFEEPDAYTYSDLLKDLHGGKVKAIDVKKEGDFGDAATATVSFKTITQKDVKEVLETLHNIDPGDTRGLENFSKNLRKITEAELLSSLEIENLSEFEAAYGTQLADETWLQEITDSLQAKQRKESRNIQIVNLSSFMGYVNQVMESDNELTVETIHPPRTNILLNLLSPLLFLVIAIAVMMFFIQRAQGSGGTGSRMSSFGKSKAKIQSDHGTKITFRDVAGLEEEKEELKEVVEFLKGPRKFVEIGARIPKGVLLVGPPGTGKTYLARAVSGEADVPFYSISGSDFVEMFVGVGASRVRDLFEEAKKNAPCIIFIDEIDAVGRRRGAGLGGGHDEREQTLNQLLVEMDGFGENQGVIVIAATNRADILDPALLRPGRFDRKVSVSVPDVKGREAILKVHGEKKKMADDVDYSVVARTTSGFTPADLENLLNEAAIMAAKADKSQIEMYHLRQAFIKVGIGGEKRSQFVSEKSRRITAFHEAGHGVLFEVLPDIAPVHIISIIPTTQGAGGYTMPLPGEDQTFMLKSEMEQRIVSILGGRAAEELVLHDISTGASNDIERASQLARAMVTQYGMSKELGPIQYGGDSEEVFIGRDWGSTRNYSEDRATKIDDVVDKIMKDAYEKAMTLLAENEEVLHKTADMLIAKEKISGEEFRALFGDKLPEKTEPREKEFMGEVLVDLDAMGVDIAPEIQDGFKDESTKELL